MEHAPEQTSIFYTQELLIPFLKLGSQQPDDEHEKVEVL